MKNSQRPNAQVHYSEAFRLKVLDDIKHRRYSISEVSLLYGVSKMSIYRWIHKYGHEEIIAKTVRVELKGEVRMIKKLKKENAELKDALAKLTLEKICMQAEMEVLREHAEHIKKKDSQSTPLSAREKWLTDTK